LDGINMANDYDPVIQEAIDFLKFCNDADTMNRQEALEDLKFVSGDQWPVELQNSRNLESRPVLTINKIDGYCRQVSNQQRQQRPRIKVHATNNHQQMVDAQDIQGIVRHIEVNSNADHAYDNAFDYAVRMGWGFMRVRTDYVSEDSFDQEIYIDPVDNPFTVYFDPNSTLPDGSDAEKCLITTMMSKEVFRSMYPENDDGTSFTQRGTGDSQSEWITKEDIRLAEYYYTVREKAKLYLLSDGTSTFADDKDFFNRLDMAGITVIDTRESFKKTIKYKKLTAIEVIEERDWPSRYIPIVPVYGRHVVIGDKRKKFGMVRYAKDPQRMYNFWQTSITESIALAPKAKWVMAEGQDEGHEMDWAQANIKSFPLLRYKQTDIEGRTAPPPQRLQPEPPPAGTMAAAGMVSDDIKAIMGIFDPAQLTQGNISGKALNGQQQQTDLTNFDYYDNLTRSISQVGKIILDLIPKIYDTSRVLRIIGEDGKPDMLSLNQRDAVGRILNDTSVGQYDVVMETGPGYNSKRQEAVDAMMPLLSKPELFNVAGDLVFRNMDFPGADVIADRLAAMNPMSQIDEKSDIPPQVQMQIMAAKKQVQDMQQQMQAMQTLIQQRGDIEQVKQEAETKRELLRQTAKAHNTETMAEVKVNDQNTRAITSQNKVEIEAITDLLLHHMDTTRLNAEIDRRNAEQQGAMRFAEQDISQGANPLTQGGQ
jgi:Phage P22-like portal protein